jgi:hypothetical protein
MHTLQQLFLHANALAHNTTHVVPKLWSWGWMHCKQHKHSQPDCQPTDWSIP